MLLSYVEPGSKEDVPGLRSELPVEVVERRSSLLRKRVTQIVSVLSRRPYVCRQIYSREMQQAIDRLCSRHRFDAIHLESSVLFAFRFPPGTPIILDEHNIEYEVFQRMREGERSLPRRLFHRLEHHRFRRFEVTSWHRVAGCVLTSDREQDIVRRHAPETETAVVPNGVDLSYFRMGTVEPDRRTIVFNGLLLYRPNLDAAYHLVDEVWPLIVRDYPDAELTIVGRAGAADLQRLRRKRVTTTGEVPDIRPHLERAAVVVVPIRMGGGTRLKVVEALAMGKAVVSTTVGCEGLSVRHEEHLLVADGAEAFAASVRCLFEDRETARALGLAGRALMEAEYSWGSAGARLAELYGRLGLLPDVAPRDLRR